jgi:diaminohydroxyphosphoribosylaminopyrimidine deaminase / 5-amino-6-(5-phosphoribosylamino)uracil reductase
MKRIHPLPPHEVWMNRAFRLARRGEGLTRPNPPVGAVVVKHGKVVGEGYHHGAGGPHAEVIALSKAGKNAKGATLYVTLEPCCTWGRTPPCTDLVLSSGVRHLVVSVRDPNPRHAGRGLSILRRNGIRVIEGICAKEGMEWIAPFAKWIQRGLPYVTLKLGMSVDGKIADRRGKSRWLTGLEARKKVHELRRRVDAILVGGGTVRSDDPSLLPRPACGRRPWRVIVSRRGRIPVNSKVLTDAAVKQTLVVVLKQCPVKTIRRLKEAGAEVLVAPAERAKISLKTLFRALASRGVLHILCEGGSELAGSMIREGLVDEYLFFIAPRVIGGTKSKSAIGGQGWLLEENPALKFISCEKVGKDFMIWALPA